MELVVVDRYSREENKLSKELYPSVNELNVIEKIFLAFVQSDSYYTSDGVYVLYKNLFKRRYVLRVDLPNTKRELSNYNTKIFLNSLKGIIIAKAMLLRNNIRTIVVELKDGNIIHRKKSRQVVNVGIS